MKVKKEIIHFYRTNIYEDEEFILDSVGDVSCGADSEINFHRNNGYEICLIPYGKGIFKIGDTTYPVSSNQLFITRASQLHGGWPSKDNPYRILFICFSIREKLPNNSIWNGLAEKLDSIKEPLVFDNYRLSDIHERLIKEILQPDNYSNGLIASLVYQFAMYSIRSFLNSKNTLLKNSLASKVMQFIEHNLSEEINLKKISQFLNYSVPYLSKNFKKETGFTIMNYLNFARLDASRKDLLESGLLISEIAIKLGFSSVQHFSTSFKTLYGVSPKDYRRKG